MVANAQRDPNSRAAGPFASTALGLRAHGLAPIPLGDELARGRIYGTTEEAHGRLETLRDGLNVFADTLHVLSLPYPPPSLPPVRHFHLVK